MRMRETNDPIRNFSGANPEMVDSPLGCLWKIYKRLSESKCDVVRQKPTSIQERILHLSSLRSRVKSRSDRSNESVSQPRQADEEVVIVTSQRRSRSVARRSRSSRGVDHPPITLLLSSPGRHARARLRTSKACFSTTTQSVQHWNSSSRREILSLISPCPNVWVSGLK